MFIYFTYIIYILKESMSDHLNQSLAYCPTGRPFSVGQLDRSPYLKFICYEFMGSALHNSPENCWLLLEPRSCFYHPTHICNHLPRWNGFNLLMMKTVTCHSPIRSCNDLSPEWITLYYMGHHKVTEGVLIMHHNEQLQICLVKVMWYGWIRCTMCNWLTLFRMISPSTINEVLYTIFAEKVLRSSFGVVWIPSIIHESWSIQLGPLSLVVRDSFKQQWNLSTNLLTWGW